MPEENYGFAQTRARLDDIVAQVRKKDVSLEKSLDLLEEGVRLANQCTELIDHADWEAAEASAAPGTRHEEPEVADAEAGPTDDGVADPASGEVAAEDSDSEDAAE